MKIIFKFFMIPLIFLTVSMPVNAKGTINDSIANAVFERLVAVKPIDAEKEREILENLLAPDNQKTVLENLASGDKFVEGSITELSADQYCLLQFFQTGCGLICLPDNPGYFFKPILPVVRKWHEENSRFFSPEMIRGYSQVRMRLDVINRLIAEDWEMLPVYVDTNVGINDFLWRLTWDKALKSLRVFYTGKLEKIRWIFLELKFGNATEKTLEKTKS